MASRTDRWISVADAATTLGLTASGVRDRLRRGGERLVVAGAARKVEEPIDGGPPRWELSETLVAEWRSSGSPAARRDRHNEELEMRRREVAALEVELERRKTEAVEAELAAAREAVKARDLRISDLEDAVRRLTETIYSMAGGSVEAAAR